jgi:hypothetical protein
VAAKSFFFALEFSSQGVPAQLLADLAAHVLEHVNAPKTELPGLAASLQKAVADEAAQGARRCDVQFKAQPTRLEIVVLSNGGRVWQTAIPLS